MRNGSDMCCRETQNTLLCSVTFFSKIVTFMVQFGKIFYTGWTTDIKTLRLMNIAWWITKAINTHTQGVQYLSLFHYNNGCTSAAQCYVIRTLPVMLSSWSQHQTNLYASFVLSACNEFLFEIYMCLCLHVLPCSLDTEQISMTFILLFTIKSVKFYCHP